MLFNITKILQSKPDPTDANHICEKRKKKSVVFEILQNQIYDFFDLLDFANNVEGNSSGLSPRIAHSL